MLKSEKIKLSIGDVFTYKKKRYLVLAGAHWRFNFRLIELDNNYKSAFICDKHYNNSHVNIIYLDDLKKVKIKKSHWSILYSHPVLARMRSLDYWFQTNKISSNIFIALFNLVADPTEKNECIFIIECLKDKRIKKLLSRKKILSACSEKSYKEAVALLNFI